jgi:hypothetical protein
MELSFASVVITKAHCSFHYLVNWIFALHTNIMFNFMVGVMWSVHSLSLWIWIFHTNVPLDVEKVQ